MAQLTSGTVQPASPYQQSLDIQNKVLQGTQFPNTASFDLSTAPSFNSLLNAQNSAPDSSGGNAASVDPYAAYGGRGAYNSLIDTRNQGINSIVNSSNTAADNLAGSTALSAQDTLHNLMLGQQGIDRKNVQNESSRIQGFRDIQSMIGRGINSGGVTLANKNAGQSSAAQAIADAYAKIGQGQASNIGNQYAQNAGDIGVAQNEQNYQLSQAPAKFHQELMNNVNNIVQSATQQLQALDQAGANASLPERIAIQQQQDQIKASVLAKLQQYDQQIQTGAAGIAPASRDANLTNANTQLAAGQADPNLFQYTTQAPAQFQGTGPFASDLPIFTSTASRKLTA